MLPINIPNVLTLLRILAVPVIVVALLDETPNGDALAAGVFALAAISDGLDGYIARRRRDVTTFGKLMDPLAAEHGVVISASWLGKVKTTLQVAAVFALIIWNPSPWPVDVLVYLALAATVISGLDYFFGLRKRLAEEREERAAAKTEPG
jgi:CDP-diacylglycerol--glycerol-3-phosphate 3-phosphatidyltransferase